MDRLPMVAIAVVAQALAGCQTGAVRNPEASGGIVVNVSDTGPGWVRAKSRICMKGAGKPATCESIENDADLRLARLAAEAGLESPAYATRGECEQGQRVSVAAEGERIALSINEIECELVQGTTTQGRGYHFGGPGDIILKCNAQGLCESAGSLGGAHQWIRVMLESGLRLPSYTSKATCQEAASYLFTQMMAEDPEMRDTYDFDAGETLRVGCTRYRMR